MSRLSIIFGIHIVHDEIQDFLCQNENDTGGFKYVTWRPTSDGAIVGDYADMPDNIVDSENAEIYDMSATTIKGKFPALDLSEIPVKFLKNVGAPRVYAVVDPE